jgi:Na+/H+-translocating membrane pyrophosphatase
VVAALVLADATAGLVGQVEAHFAEHDPRLDLADRLGQRTGIVIGRTQDVKGQPLGRAVADPREL